ncbi:MAG: hypothetical protein LBL73_05240 [Synergistaceae bacterium]|nr:hypothetical protein [Synergistaceae bacterium]
MHWKEKNGARRMDVQAESESPYEFCIFARAALDDPNDFSVGLRITFQDGSKFNIMRCNGNHGRHKNLIEQERIEDLCHVHIATSRYIVSGLSAEGFAENTSEYKTVEGALEYLMKRCNVSYERYPFQ